VLGGALGGPAGAAIGGLAGKFGGSALSKAFRKSDVTAKTDIEPASKSELFGGRETPYARGGKTGLDVQGPGGAAFDRAMGEQAYAEGADGRRRQALAAGYFSHLPGMLQGGSGAPPQLNPGRRRMAMPTIGGPVVTSDIDAKTDLREAKGYSYEYKDPDAPGAAHGRQVGPMAQDLQKTSARDAVVKGRDGKLGVDTGRLSLRNTAAISQQQRDLDELRAMIAELGAGPPATAGVQRGSSAGRYY
jgi:hypothetical protein